MNEYDEYDIVYYCDDYPNTGTHPHRRLTRYDLDTLTPAEIEAYERYEYDKFSS